MGTDNRDDSQDNPTIWGTETNIPYGRRSVRSIAGALFGILVLVLSVSWFFSLSGPDAREETRIAERTGNAQISSTRNAQTTGASTSQKPGNAYEEGSGRSAIYDFFYKLFGGIEAGPEESPHNLDNVEHVREAQIDDTLTEGGMAPGYARLPEEPQTAAADSAAGAGTGAAKTDSGHPVPRHALSTVIGSTVYDSAGVPAGTLYDIIVSRDSGKARTLIFREDGGAFSANDLAAVDFRKALKQKPGGAVYLALPETALNNRKPFRYSGENAQTVSLRHLRDGQVIDHDGRIAGQIDALIYREAQALRVVFAIPLPVPGRREAETARFTLPFEDAQIIRDADGYEMTLTLEQTKALARHVLDDSAPASP